MAELLFYHLERQPLESALPGLLQRSLERGWRVVVKVGSEERLEALNAHLWSFDDASFLPHGAAADGHAEAQPIWLTTGDDNPNGATVRFLVDGAEAADLAGYERIVFMFDAADQRGGREGARRLEGGRRRRTTPPTGSRTRTAAGRSRPELGSQSASASASRASSSCRQVEPLRFRAREIVHVAGARLGERRGLLGVARVEIRRGELLVEALDLAAELFDQRARQR